MPAVRVAPCLGILGGRVVKVEPSGGRGDAGDPVEMASRYYREGADELYVMDVSGTDEGMKAALGVIRKVSRRVFVPLTFGDARCMEDAREALLAGADRVCMTAAPLGRPGIIEECASVFGSQCIVLAIDAKRVKDSWHVLVNGGGGSGRDAIEWAREGVALGAGEILVRSMDADGGMRGYDIGLIRAVAEAVSVPVMASGGAGSPEHVYQAIQEGGADGAVLASALHSRLCTISQIKGYLASRGITVRA
jgi:cyclase